MTEDTCVVEEQNVPVVLSDLVGVEEFEGAAFTSDQLAPGDGECKEDEEVSHNGTNKWSALASYRQPTVFYQFVTSEGNKSSVLPPGQSSIGEPEVGEIMLF